MTDTIHDKTRAAVMTGNKSLQNSDAAPSAKATGMKPEQVMSVPVSMGLAVALKA